MNTAYKPVSDKQLFSDFLDWYKEVDRYSGLCTQLYLYAQSITKEESIEVYREVCSRLETSVTRALRTDFGANSRYPFGGLARYMKDCQQGALKNEARMAWLDRTIEALKAKDE